MDKSNSNKSRTDMLAAGRKKLQQYRKKKDGKGSKKGGKSEHDAKTDAEAKAADPADAKPPVSGGEGSGSVNVADVKPAVSGDEGSGSDYGRELVNAPFLHSTESSVAADFGQLISGSLPEVVKLQADVAEADEVDQRSNVCNERGEYSSVQNKAKTSSDIDTDTANKLSSEILEMAGSEEKPDRVSVSTPVDFFDASDSVSDDREGGDAIEVKPMHGVDQEAEYASSENIDKSRVVEFKEDESVAISGADVSSFLRNPHDVSAYDGSFTEVKEQKVDEHSDFCKPSTLEADGAAVTAEVMTEDMMVDSLKEENPKALMSDDDFANKMIFWTDGSSVSLSQLSRVVHRLHEDEFSFLLAARKQASKDISGFSVHGSGFSDVLEPLKEQLYLTNFAKDVYRIMHGDIDSKHYQLVNEYSVATASLSEARLKNENLALELQKCLSEFHLADSERGDLQKELGLVKAEFVKISTRSDELQDELMMSQKELGNVLTDLADCRNLVAALQIENENMSRNLASVTEENANSIKNVALITNEKLKLEEEKDSHLNEFKKASTELADYKALAESLLLEKDNLKGILVSFTEEHNFAIHETEKLFTELIEYKVIAETLQQEKFNLNNSLALIAEERKELTEEKDKALYDKEKALADITLCKNLMAGKQLELEEAINNLKEAALHLEGLTEENLLLTSTMDIFKATIKEYQMEEQASLDSVRDCNMILSSILVQERSLSDASNAECLPLAPLELDVYDDSYGFVSLRGHLLQAGKVLHKLEKSIEEMHSQTDSLRRSSTKGGAPAVSKLIQAFESKSQTDDHEAEGVPLAEEQSHADLYTSTKEQTGYLRIILNEISVVAENAGELIKVEKNGKVAADFAFKELKVHYDALLGQSCELGEAKIELLVLYELIRQHMCNTEEKKDELLRFYDTLRQQNNISKAESNELENKLSAYESIIDDMQGKFDELQQKSHEMNSSYCIQMEMLHKEVSDKTLTLEQKWRDIVSWLVSAVEKLNSHIEASPSNYLTDTSDENDIRSHVVASFEGATRMVDNLREKLDGARSDYELTCCSYRDLTEKFNNLNGHHELATGLLHKIFASLGELVSDSSEHVEESEAEITKLVDPLNSIIEQLRNLLEERLLLKSLMNEINSDLIDKTNKVEELNRRCFDGDAIMKLVKQVEDVVNLKGLEINTDEPTSFIESLIYLLVQRYKEANDVAVSCKENLGVTEMKFSELHAQVDHIIFTFVHCDNESVIYKESLKNVMEDLVLLRSQILKKVTELEQSEQRVSSLREKLSIAVAKGKGLIVQRDSLKQSLAEKSGEWERCLQELQLKDAQLIEVETKLKAYSEAGERVEALESELSYIRNSATALRESFLLKDSVLHRIEEILEDLELPEHFHARDIIEKIDWLASAVTGNSLAPAEWDQKSGAGEGSHTDTWKEEMPIHSNQENESTRKYDDLQSKFYALAEQNEMLEQSLMERNNLVQRWEEILDKINMPSQLRSMEPEDRIEWLGGALSEAVHRCESLQQKVDNVETFCGSLSTDLEESRKKTSGLEAALQSVTNEKEHLSTSLETLTRDNSIVSQKADEFELEKNKMQSEVAELKEKLEVLQVIEQRDHHVESEIRRLQDFLGDVLQENESGEQNLGMTSIEDLEQLLKKLVQKYTDLSAQEVKSAVNIGEHISGTDSVTLGERTRSAYAEDQKVVSLSKQLEEVTGELERVKDDVVFYTEKNKTLTHELERLEAERVELQELLKQEEQKTASVKEKLNMAVRKGKSLVQQRDSMRRTIDELTVETERLRSELITREAALSEYKQKIINCQEMIEGAESKSLILENQLAETEHDRKDKIHTLNAICSSLDEIDISSGYNAVDPLNKIVQIGKICHSLQAAVTSSEHEANKSKRAAELLLAELNEVQERNDGLQEELVKVANEVSKLAMEKNLAEAAKHEALLQFENLNALLLEKRNDQISEFSALAPSVYQLRSSFSDFIKLLDDAFFKDLELVHNLVTTSKSSLKSSDAAGIGQTISGKEVSSVHDEFLSASYVPERKQDQFNNSTQSEICEFIECNLQELLVEISGVKAKLNKHTSVLHTEAKILSETVGSMHKEMTTQYEFCESAKREMFRLESIEKQKDTEIMVLRRDISMLYEACKSSAAELRNWKSQKVEKGLVVQDQGFNYDSTTAVTEGDLFGQTNSMSGGFVSTVADELLLAIKEIVSAQNENVEVSQMELKAEIANLQTELQEKNIEKDKICFELVNQIKEAESTAMRYSQELQSANDHKHDLERRMDVLERERSSLQKTVEEERNRFQQKVDELKDREAAYIDMQDRIRSLTDVLAAKEQEAEAIMQALDEEEAEMEVLRNKNEELETVLNKKNIDLLNAEASLGKTSKKLSATVRKFDELHHLSENLLSEIEKLQSQLHDRDSEVSFLRQEVTRCTNDAIAASQMSKNRNSDEMHDLLSWLDSVASQVLVHNRHSDDKERNQDHEYKERLQKQIMAIITDLEDQRAVMQSKDNLLRLERSRVEDLIRKGESLEKVLQEKEAELTIIRDVENSGQGTSMASETTEAESVTNKWPVPGSSSVSQFRSLRKGNNDQVAISVDMEPGSGHDLENEDDDKAHGFKSLTTSKVVPRFTRPVTDLVDGLWVSCDRALMRQPALRLGVIMYWFILHALVATFAI
ncbi:uncharacterized protein LOC141683121 isoform X2 [Apium graveolens]|uniref:uncharacterized protein LOC141683121 isoform X2 n=1 Tax=Apium graveolens TaxID=4045 RepID=UPI003D78B59D